MHTQILFAANVHFDALAKNRVDHAVPAINSVLRCHQV